MGDGGGSGGGEEEDGGLIKHYFCNDPYQVLSYSSGGRVAGMRRTKRGREIFVWLSLVVSSKHQEQSYVKKLNKKNK